MLSPAEETTVKARTYLDNFADLKALSIQEPDLEVQAIFGGAHIDSSFKNLLGMGLLQIAREKGMLKQGGRVIESSSGSMGEGLTVAGRIMGHPVTIVSDPNMPELTRQKISMAGGKIVVPNKPHPVLGWQQAREDKVREILAANPDMYWTDQNNNLAAVEVYRRWLVPKLSRYLNPNAFDAAVFCVGSGGHFSAISFWLKQVNPSIKTYAADRPGSITFGGTPGGSNLRGVGNQNIIPAVIKANMHLVDSVVRIDDRTAFQTTRLLAKKHGLFVGGSSGAAYAAALELHHNKGFRRILTLFPDRGELYAQTIWSEQWMVANGYA